MNMTELVQALKAYVDSQPLIFQDGEAKTILEMLFDIYAECKGFDSEIIRKDFNALCRNEW